MPSTFSPLKIQLMATGENNTTWGDVTNLNLGTALEEAIVGSADVTFASADVTLTLTDTNASQTARNMRLRCTGTTGGSTRNLIVPSIEKPYIVKNDCADSIVVKTAAGTGITVPAGKTMWVYTDATNVVDAVTHLSSLTLSTPLPVSSGGTGVNTSLTAGSVVFAGASGAYSQDNANFFWDDTNNRLGIGTNTPLSALDVIGNIRIPSTNSLYWAGGNELINAVENSRMTFFVAGSERMRINSSGNVGIGVTPSTWTDYTALQVGALGGAALAGTVNNTFLSSNAYYNSGFKYAATGAGATYYQQTSSEHRFFNAPSGTAGNAISFTQAMTLDASGNLGVGTASPLTTLHVQSATSSTMTRLTSALTGSLYYSGYEVNRAGTAGGALMRSARNAAVGGVGWEWLTTADNAAELAGTYTSGMTLNNYGNVGIGVTAPSQRLEVNGAMRVGGAAGVGFINFSSTVAFDTSAIGCAVTTGFGDSLGLAVQNATGVMTLATNSTERMRITSAGDVGIGYSTLYDKLQVAGSVSSQGGGYFGFYRNGPSNNIGTLDGVTIAQFGVSAGVATGRSDASTWLSGFDSLRLVTAGIERMRIDASGNVGINATPSPWSSGYRALQIAGQGAGLFANVTSSQVVLGSNGYYNGTNWIYNNSDTAGQYWIDGNVHKWFNASGGSAGSTITFTERMRIDSSGNVGIGTSSPDAKLTVNSTAGLAFALNSTGDTYIQLRRNGVNGAYFQTTAGGAYLWNQENTGFLFGTNNAERMRISAAGNVGIGTSSPSTKLVVSNAGAEGLEINPTGGVNNGALISVYNRTALAYANLTTYASAMTWYANGTTRAMDLDSSGNVGIGTTSPADKLTVNGFITTTAGAYSSTNGGNAVKLGAAGQMNFGAGGSDLILATNAGNIRFGDWNTNTERMRIDTSGNLLVGTTSASTTSSSGVKVLPAEGGANNPQLSIVTSASTGTTASLAIYSTGASALRFYVDNGGTIYATSTSISAISDQRLKENVRDLDAGLDTILALKPRRFDWKAGKGKDVRDDMGFIAQEVEEVLPALIGGWKAGEGEPDDLKSVKAGDLIPVLVKAIQELTARVAQLEGN